MRKVNSEFSYFLMLDNDLQYCCDFFSWKGNSETNQRQEIGLWICQHCDTVFVTGGRKKVREY